jgi:hypothetical protein
MSKEVQDQQPTGHVGNLTAEQEVKLREFWAVLLKVLGVDVKDAPERKLLRPVESDSDSSSPPAATADAKKTKKRMGIFSRKNNSNSNGSGTSESESVTSGNGLAESTGSLKISDLDDKYGQTKEFHGILANTSPEELRIAFWSMVKHDHPDMLVLRFLRARKWDVGHALVMLISTIRWRSKEMHLDDKIMPNGDQVPQTDDDEEVKTAEGFSKLLHLGESFVHGRDKSGRPICYIRVKMHKIGAHSEASLERFTVYLIETTRFLIQYPVETAAIVFDMSDFSLANMDYTPLKFMIKCFEANYPESLGVVLIHKAPWIFSGIWSIIKGWLDPVVASKVHFTKTHEDLEEHIARNQIPKELGGDDDFEYKYAEPVANENEKLKDTASRDALLIERVHKATEFQSATISWIATAGADDNGENSKIMKARDGIATALRDNYWQLDPYIRARSMYDRLGMLPPQPSTAAPTSSAAVSVRRSTSTKRNGEVVTTKAIQPEEEIAVVN